MILDTMPTPSKTILHKSHTGAGNCVIKLAPGGWNVGVVAQDDVSFALSITGATGRPLVEQSQKGRAITDAPDWIDLQEENDGRHLPYDGIGFWRGTRGFQTEAAACEVLLEILGEGNYAYCCDLKKDCSC